ncbi:MAG: class I SAM-dependent methyltransferase [Pseudomonadota bacterium]
MDAVRTPPASGYQIYSPFLLRYIYDQLILGGNSRFFWGCPPAKLLRHFEKHVTGNHLDIGVGTGYFLDKARNVPQTARICLMDLNPNTLAHCEKRLARYAPQTLQHDALAPLGEDIAPFSSISLNYVLHCMPGTLLEKKGAIAHHTRHLKPKGVFFGATILNEGVSVPFYSKPMLHMALRNGAMNNARDSRADLEAILEETFDRWEIEISGMVALFAGWRAD